MSKRKKYNPLKYENMMLHPAALQPIFEPLDYLNELLKRGYLTDKLVKMANSSDLDMEYLLMIFLYQHTFVVDHILENKVLLYIKSIRKVIENYFEKILNAAKKDECVIPEKVVMGKVGCGKLLWFLKEHKKIFLNLKKFRYKKALQDGIKSNMLYLQFHPELAINYFIDKSLDSLTLLDRM